MKKLYPVNALLIDYATPLATRGVAPKEPKKLKAGDLEFTIQPFKNISPGPTMGTRGLAQKTTLAKAVLKKHTGSANPWDVAHHAKQHSKDLQLKFVEPDIIHVNEAANDAMLTKEITRGFGKKDVSGPYDEEWSHPDDKGTIWHLGEDYSQLKQARDAVMKNMSAKVRIAHLDTGYIKGHKMLPDHILTDLQRNCGHDDDIKDDAADRGNPIVNGVGHGTSTMILLAGKKINYPEFKFNDYLGGAPWADIVPVRVSRSVILLATSSLVEALDYVIGLGIDPSTRCDVVTMSMGGLASRAWATAVNTAYDNGIFIAAASGDNTGGLPTTRTVYPARFRRVVNVTGVCYDYTPYYHGNFFHTLAVEGNFGPEFLMDNAIAAFTPNVPWIKHGDNNDVALDKIGLGGAGTSSATPMVAAAAANYIRKYNDALNKLLPWQKVEAVRNALFKSAYKRNVSGNNMRLYYGNGVLKANDALSIDVNTSVLTKQPEDEVRFPLFHLLFRDFRPAGGDEAFMQMIEVEMLQIINSDASFQDILDPVKYDFAALDKRQKKKLIDAIIGSPMASNTLKNFLKTNYTRIINQ